MESPANATIENAVSTTNVVPPLRQSLVEVAACPHSYGIQVIEGKKMPGGLQSARGSEIHAVQAAYVRTCALKRVPADWALFDRISAGAGTEAAAILIGLRDTYVVDYENLYGTEVTLRLDGDHQPTESEEESAEEGTIDALFFYDNRSAKIEDYKSHPRPFEPDTFQSMLYPFLVFQTFPQVQDVTFELIFVRYANCRRSVTYTRADVPMLAQQVMNARIRQADMHDAYAQGRTLEAFPGNHCQYCPLLQSFSCPIAETNPHAAVTKEERLRFAIWLTQVKKVNDEVLKSIVDATGEPLQMRDGNGRLVQIGYRDHESRQYPLLQTLPILMEYREAAPDDVAWIDKLVVGSTQMKSYLKAKKRAFLHQRIDDEASVVVSKPKFEISLPAESETEEKKYEWED